MSGQGRSTFLPDGLDAIDHRRELRGTHPVLERIGTRIREFGPGGGRLADLAKDTPRVR